MVHMSKCKTAAFLRAKIHVITPNGIQSTRSISMQAPTKREVRRQYFNGGRDKRLKGYTDMGYQIIKVEKPVTEYCEYADVYL